MNDRKSEIRRLQGLIAIEEAQRAILIKRNLYSDARQVLLDNLKIKLAYEQKMELEEIKHP
jgi:hypothetical protein